jgi:hypothetical protein
LILDRRSSRSNVRFPSASRTINHQELPELIGTGSIGGEKRQGGRMKTKGVLSSSGVYLWFDWVFLR